MGEPAQAPHAQHAHSTEHDPAGKTHGHGDAPEVPRSGLLAPADEADHGGTHSKHHEVSGPPGPTPSQAQWLNPLLGSFAALLLLAILLRPVAQWMKLGPTEEEAHADEHAHH
jgi:hypothetical protein